jgi:hypothetical protein
MPGGAHGVFLQEIQATGDEPDGKRLRPLEFRGGFLLLDVEKREPCPRARQDRDEDKDEDDEKSFCSDVHGASPFNPLDQVQRIFSF